MTTYQFAIWNGTTWVFGPGTFSVPLRVWNGTRWLVFAGGPGPALKIRNEGGIWVTIATQGYQFGHIHGQVTGRRTGLPLADRGIYLHEDFPVGTVAGFVTTDAAGHYDYQFVPTDRPIYVRVFIYPNNFNYANSTVYGPYTFTESSQDQTINMTSPD